MKTHPYTVADGSTQRIWLALALISIIVTSVVVFAVAPVVPTLVAMVFPSNADSGKLWEAWAVLRPVIHGSPLLICYFIVYAVFDRWAWKWRIINEVPDLNGTWKGTLVSEKRPHDPLTVTLKIRQTWSKIMITIDSDATLSRSVSASVTFEGHDSVRLINTYVAEAKPGVSSPPITRHFGTNIFHLSLRDRRLEEIVGDYYTERNHGSTGSFRFK